MARAVPVFPHWEVPTNLVSFVMGASQSKADEEPKVFYNETPIQVLSAIFCSHCCHLIPAVL